MKTLKPLKSFFTYLPLALLSIACDTSDDEITADNGYDYFPLRVGTYLIYDVNETIYSQLSEPQHYEYELKSEIVDSFPNGGGSFTYVVHHSNRHGEADEWAYKETSSFRIDDTQAVATVEGISYVKLAFPLEQGAVWNGNNQNNLAADDYEAIQVDVPLEMNGLSFAETTTVEQELYDDQVTKTDKRVEVYARGIGLISREVTQLTYCTEEVCLNDRIIDSGIIYQQTIKAYGQL